MKFKTQRVNDVWILMPQGSLLNPQDVADLRAQFLRELKDNRQKKFIFDLHALEHANSAWLNFMVAALQAATAHQASLVLCNVPAHVQNMLVLTKLNGFFRIANKTADALQLLNA